VTKDSSFDVQANGLGVRRGCHYFLRDDELWSTSHKPINSKSESYVADEMTRNSSSSRHLSRLGYLEEVQPAHSHTPESLEGRC
jgi:hypothetical protein